MANDTTPFNEIDEQFRLDHIGLKLKGLHPITQLDTVAEIVDVKWDATVWNIKEQDDGAYLALYQFPDGLQTWGYCRE